MGFFLKCLPIAIGAGIGFCYHQNNSFKTTKICLNADVKNLLNFIQISDLHSKEFGKDNNKLKEKVLSFHPDIIFATGDIIDSNLKNFDKTLNFLIDLNKKCPVVYIPGNNENRIKELSLILKTLKENNVITLQNEFAKITVKNQEINILGLSELLDAHNKFGLNRLKATYHLTGYEKLLKELESKTGFKILLSHYPEKVSLKGDYSTYNFHIMLSGHAHGGQFILPFLGGLFAPGQGILPKFYGGLYPGTKGHLIVSRGLGNSGFPLRLFNRPDIVNIKIEPKSI
ncbi:metallophosphoesterase [uncultured Clostridium sp.]|uniref:metallophosphoesterase n=1 Tax=uncultured Clostridium sp. TaxID=59620 RepID=UPI002637ABAD|nr:metallophosphoesterase [uncultured Clostridium sp.]